MCICSQQHADRNCEVHFPQPDKSEREALVELIEDTLDKDPVGVSVDAQGSVARILADAILAALGRWYKEK